MEESWGQKFEHFLDKRVDVAYYWGIQRGKMLSSMTGYGRGTEEIEGEKGVVEIRSVNNRFLDLQLKLPRSLNFLEDRIRELLRRNLSRGKIYYLLTWAGTDEPFSSLKLNEEATEAYYLLLEKLKNKFKFKEEIGLNHLIGFPDLLKKEVQELDLDRIWPTVEKATIAALSELKKMREKEGEKLSQDVLERMNSLRELENWVEGEAPKVVERRREELRVKIENLGIGGDVDEERLAQEVTIFAERTDITEECVRLKSHIQQFVSISQKGGVVGRKLTFLLQEMNREANTMGAKALDASISQKVVEMKEELEKVREQLQNVE